MAIFFVMKPMDQTHPNESKSSLQISFKWSVTVLQFLLWNSHAPDSRGCARYFPSHLSQEKESKVYICREKMYVCRMYLNTGRPWLDWSSAKYFNALHIDSGKYQDLALAIDLNFWRQMKKDFLWFQGLYVTSVYNCMVCTTYTFIHCKVNCITIETCSKKKKHRCKM